MACGLVRAVCTEVCLYGGRIVGGAIYCQTCGLVVGLGESLVAAVSTGNDVLRVEIPSLVIYHIAHLGCVDVIVHEIRVGQVVLCGDDAVAVYGRNYCAVFQGLFLQMVVLVVGVVTFPSVGDA